MLYQCKINTVSGQNKIRYKLYSVNVDVINYKRYFFNTNVIVALCCIKMYIIVNKN